MPPWNTRTHLDVTSGIVFAREQARRGRAPAGTFTARMLMAGTFTGGMQSPSEQTDGAADADGRSTDGR